MAQKTNASILFAPPCSSLKFSLGRLVCRECRHRRWPWSLVTSPAPLPARTGSEWMAHGTRSPLSGVRLWTAHSERGLSPSRLSFLAGYQRIPGELSQSPVSCLGGWPSRLSNPHPKVIRIWDFDWASSDWTVALHFTIKDLQLISVGQDECHRMVRFEGCVTQNMHSALLISLMHTVVLQGDPGLLRFKNDT